MLQIVLFILILTINGEVPYYITNNLPPPKGNLDTDLLGIADPEGEVMKTDKLSPRRLKAKTESSYLLIVSLNHSVTIHACLADLIVLLTQSGIFRDIWILPSPPYLCSLSKKREEL